jgi:predicted DNA-binding protein
MNVARKIISVPISAELKSDLDALAQDDHRSIASYVRLVLERHLKEQRTARPNIFEPRLEPQAEAAHA